MSAAVTIRPLQPQDYDAWRPLWDGYNAFYGRADATALPEAVTQTTWARFFDGLEPMHGLVAERAGKIVGIVHYLFHRSTLQTEPNCYLQDLFTEASLRGQGIGRALIEAAGTPRIYWMTQTDNHTARRLYDKVADNTGFMIYRKAAG